MKFSLKQLFGVMTVIALVLVLVRPIVSLIYYHLPQESRCLFSLPFALPLFIFGNTEQVEKAIAFLQHYDPITMSEYARSAIIFAMFINFVGGLVAHIFYILGIFWLFDFTLKSFDLKKTSQQEEDDYQREEEEDEKRR